jgi:hypothetical protein
MNCSICNKVIPDGATQCSAKCLSEARLADVARISSARQSFFGAMGNMLKMEVEPTEPAPLATVVVTHRGKRGKGAVVGETFFKFNEAGIARVPYRGHVLIDVEGLVRASNGLAEYVIEQPVLVTPDLSALPPMPAAEAEILSITDSVLPSHSDPEIAEPIAKLVESDEESPTDEMPFAMDLLSDSVKQPARQPVRAKTRKGD